jgi:putative addiction module killer protein
VGEGVFELRVHEGRGYRVYFGRDDKAFVILLCGGDNSTQHRDIDLARAYWRAYRR